jgi:hypothetical protein
VRLIGSISHPAEGTGLLILSGQKAPIVQQGTEFLPHQDVQRLAAVARHRTTPDFGAAAPDQVGQCYAQASLNPFNLMIDVAEEGGPMDARGLCLFPDRFAPVIV